MHVVVAGGAGDLGSSIARAFAALGVPTTALVHPRTDAWRLQDQRGVDVARVDLLDTAAVAEVLRSHRDVVVVDAAGRSDTPGPTVGPSRVALWRDTVLTTVSLSRPSIPTASRASSTSAAPRLPPRRLSPWRRPAHYAPTTARGVAKRAAASALWQWAAETGVPCSELVVFRAYGPASPPDGWSRRWSTPYGPARRFLSSMPRPAATWSTSTTSPRRSSAWSTAAAYGVPVNVGSGVASTVPEIVAAFEAASGRRVRVAPGARPARAYDVPHWQADLTRCEELLGWRPAHHPRRGHGAGVGGGVGRMTATTHAERLAPLEQEHFWFAGRDRLVRRLLDHHAAPEPVLDLGCGTGRFAASLAADGRRVLAIDPAPDLALAPPGARPWSAAPNSSPSPTGRSAP